MAQLETAESHGGAGADVPQRLDDLRLQSHSSLSPVSPAEDSVFRGVSKTPLHLDVEHASASIIGEGEISTISAQLVLVASIVWWLGEALAVAGFDAVLWLVSQDYGLLVGSVIVCNGLTQMS